MTGIDARSLVIVDEAGLASTPKLDAAIRFVLARGGRVLLVGDDRQRAAAGAGGVLRDIDAAHGAVTLARCCGSPTPPKGTPPWRCAPVTPPRSGSTPTGPGCTPSPPTPPPTPSTAAWAADIAAGVDSVMIAPTLDMVAQLNARARADRIAAAGGSDSGRSWCCRTGNGVAPATRSITKRNKRTSVDGRHRLRPEQLPVDRAPGQPGRVAAGHRDRPRRAPGCCPPGTSRPGILRLGYAYTHASVQGMTVGAAAPPDEGTAHTVVTDRMTRQDLYPTLTRADRRHPRLRRSSAVTGDPHEVITPDAIQPPTAIEVLDRGDRPGRRRPVRDHRDPRRPRPGVAARARRRRLRARPRRSAPSPSSARTGSRPSPPAPSRRSRVSPSAPAWDTLLGHLAVLALDGHDPIALLADAAAERELDTATDVAAVLDYRLDPTGNHSQRPGPLPWIPDIPAALAEHPCGRRISPPAAR